MQGAIVEDTEVTEKSVFIILKNLCDLRVLRGEILLGYNMHVFYK